MWGDGGKFYWGIKEDKKAEGIVVIFAWMSSQEKHLRNYVDLYASLGWNSLVCHSEFLNLFSPDRATSLAIDVVNELIKELRTRPSPVVFAAFSGGPKSCMYKVFQIIDGTCETQLNLDECQLVRDCICGQVYDSSPVDFTSDLGTRFVLHPSVLQMSNPPRFVSWIANGIASGLDSIFLGRFESQRAEYWQTLYSTANMGAPFLILCSEDDDLAPYQIICNFAQRLQELGSDVKVVKWNNSPHVGHYRHYPTDYKAAVTELLGKAALVYSRKIQKLQGGEGMERTTEEISESICNLRNAAMTSSQSLLKVAVEPSDHFFLPGLNETHEGREVGSAAEERKEGLIHLHSPPAINAHGIIGQILFDVCVPKNIEGWDIKPSSSLTGQTYASARRVRPFNPIKCIRRSRL
ncbi:hypothetical protein AQUCO_00700620v1 [Aquilegia coerulea]|uniref:DUF829 domain-containing protein n=1 Tax=Aquilegia coerulea TaxID=218851 RepID=A0A2G5EKX6_AQUCA|nr:hypothetical protein AQUCO_00700620v1 [Aquilegia coerulea]